LICSFIRGSLIAIFVPRVPRVLRNLLRHEIAAPIGRIARQRLARLHIGLIAALRADMRRSIQHRDHSWRFIQVNSDRRIRHRRDRIAIRVDAVGELGIRPQLGIDQTMHHSELGLEVPSVIRAQHAQTQRGVRCQSHQASVLELDLRLSILARRHAHTSRQRHVDHRWIVARIVHVLHGNAALKVAKPGSALRRNIVSPCPNRRP